MESLCQVIGTFVVLGEPPYPQTEGSREPQAGLHQQSVPPSAGFPFGGKRSPHFEWLCCYPAFTWLQMCPLRNRPIICCPPSAAAVKIALLGRSRSNC